MKDIGAICEQQDTCINNADARFISLQELDGWDTYNELSKIVSTKKTTEWKLETEKG